MNLNQIHSGCKVNSNFPRPDIVLLGEKVGRNTGMNGDGHIVLEKAIFGKGCIAQIKTTTK